MYDFIAGPKWITWRCNKIFTWRWTYSELQWTFGVHILHFYHLMLPNSSPHKSYVAPQQQENLRKLKYANELPSLLEFAWFLSVRACFMCVFSLPHRRRVPAQFMHSNRQLPFVSSTAKLDMRQLIYDSHPEMIINNTNGLLNWCRLHLQASLFAIFCENHIINNYLLAPRKTTSTRE